jgi:general secretion pathway protein G
VLRFEAGESRTGAHVPARLEPERRQEDEISMATPKSLQTLKKRNGSSGGFTLIELLVVLVILSVLAGIVVFAVGSTASNASAASCSSQATTIETALSSYYAQMGTYPADLTTLESGTVDANGTPVGPWLGSLPSTDHYVFFEDPSDGTLYVAPPDYPSYAKGDGYSLDGNTPTTATPGSMWDVAANPSICSQFS